MPLKIRIGTTESYDEGAQRYVETGGTVVELEHSLVSLSKWESKWEIPFLGDSDKTVEQTLDYIKCMYTGDEFPPELFSQIRDKDVTAVTAYIDSKQTATTIREAPGTGSQGGRKQIITSELVYSWMVQYRIPVEFQHWHFNRLIMLVRVLNEQNKSQEGKKMTKAQIAQRNRELNAKRRAEYGTRG